MTARWDDPNYPDPRGPIDGDVMAELDAHLDAEMARLLAAAEEADRMAEEDAAYQMRRAMDRHPSTRGNLVTHVGAMTRIEEVAPIPARSEIGRRIASVASSVLLGGGVVLGALVIGGYLPRLAGPTVLCALCLGGGVFITYYLERDTKEQR